MTRLHLLIILLILSPLSLAGAEADPLLPRKIDSPPVIDGILDEEVWKEAPSVTGFKTFSPDFGLDASEETVVWMLYDEENLYFAFRCYDSEPDRIKASINSRDNIRPDDWVCINLDSFNDHQSLYAFYVNPHGIQMDSRFSANQEDASVDFVWYSAGVPDSKGYSIEIRIPLKSIRFSSREPVEMSVFFERKISRNTEQSSFPAMDPARGYAFLTQMQPMIYEGVKHYKLFELLPAFTYTYRDIHSDGELSSDTRRPALSLTAKYGITSQLILDGTLNPDFSQVEADAGQVDVNLRYKIFYPEKRPFFLEGNDNFIMAATQADEHDPVNTLLHTRSIINPLTGVKLTGKASDRVTLAALYAADRVENIYNPEQTDLAHFPVLRMKYSLSDDSYLGTLYTGRETDSTFNRVAGLDGALRTGKGSSVMYNALLSSTLMAPGSDMVNGYMVSGEYAFDDRNLTLSAGGKSIGEGFHVETGFINRTGINYFKLLVKPKFYPESELFRRIDVELFSKQTQDISYNMWETVDHLAAWIFFKGSTYIKVKGEYSTEVFLGERFKTGGFHALLSSQIGTRITGAVLYQHLGDIYYSIDPYQGYTNRMVAMVTYKPVDKLHFDLTFRYTDFVESNPERLVYDYTIARGKVTWQMNKYFFLRAITEYNSYRENLLTDFLASFNYIPGTVVYLGYGSLYEKVEWDGNDYNPAERFLETRRGFFFKCSWLARF